MSASFVAGAKKIFAAAEPRFVVLYGDEYELRTKLTESIYARNYEVYAYESGSFRSIDAFTPALRQSKQKLIHITEATRVDSWDWLPPWFNKVKNARLLIETGDAVLAEKLGHKANTRGLAIKCSAPTTVSSQDKLLKMIANWYPHFSTSQINLMLNKNDWKASECLQLMERLTLLNLPLNSDTMMMLGFNFNPDEEFIAALQENHTSRALTVASRVNNGSKAVKALSAWLDSLARVKFASGFMKSSHELAREVGESRSAVELLQKQSRKFDLTKINRAALALANADRDYAKGYINGTLEMLVNSW